MYFHEQEERHGCFRNGCSTRCCRHPQKWGVCYERDHRSHHARPWNMVRLCCTDWKGTRGTSETGGGETVADERGGRDEADGRLLPDGAGLSADGDGDANRSGLRIFGRAFNELLRDMGIQFRQNEQWILYARLKARGTWWVHGHLYTVWRVAGDKDVHAVDATGRLYLYETEKVGIEPCQPKSLAFRVFWAYSIRPTNKSLCVWGMRYAPTRRRGRIKRQRVKMMPNATIGGNQKINDQLK